MSDAVRGATHLALAVDDDSRVRSYIKTVLESAHYRVLEARDGMEALELFRLFNTTLEIVVTDIRMPRMTGTELAAVLRSESPALPLVFISGEPATEDTDDPNRGIVFVEKPFAPGVLLDAVRRVLTFPRVA